MRTILALTIALLAPIVLARPAGAQPDLSELDPGVTLRVFHSGRPLEMVAEPVPGFSPNLDARRPTIDFDGPSDFAPVLSTTGVIEYEDHFIAVVTGYVRTTEPGVHTFRLTSDDGSMMHLDGERLIWNRGVHAPTPADGALKLDPGLHGFKILFFENSGGEMLRLEWSTPGADGFEIVPESALFTEAGVTRVVSPGIKPTSHDVEGMRAGDGIYLDRPHPSYTIDTIHPDGFDPMVGCLTTLPDGRLLIGTFEPRNNGVQLTEPDGTLWTLTNIPEPGGDHPNGIVVEEFAQGFYHPLGMCVVDGALYIAERDQITRMQDLDGDGDYETRSTLASGWTNDNYHHFTFGLAHHDGYLYATLSTSIGSAGEEVTAGEIIGINGPNPANRGTLMKIDIQTGAIEYVAGGFRTPNGVLADDAGRVFVGENQGAWQPACRVNHVQPGRFYGHYNETHATTASYPEGGVPALFSEAGPTALPALWLPQNEVCNSPTSFLMVPAGSFEGQMLIGELKLGGIRRASLEEVNGVVQGAVFRFSQGFEGGVNRLLWGPEINGEPTIYVGCIGEQATWSWRGTRTGLQRMTPTGDDSTLEFHSINATETGFTLHFTRPASVEDLRDPSTYTLSQWRYTPVPDYGGPKVDLEPLSVTEAVPSEDGRSVTITVPGLKPGRCVYLRADPAGAGGETMWSPEAWYTLNEIPGQPTERVAPGPKKDDPPRVLIFSKTAGFRHGSIEAGVESIQKLGTENGFAVEHTEDSGEFTDANLARFGVVVFLNTTQNVLNLAQEAAFERYIRAGGGYVGVHAATDTEYDWPWYGRLVGAYFSGHPHIQQADVKILDDNHPATADLPETWTRTDEWYNFRAELAQGVRVLAVLDEGSYEGGDMEGRVGSHPIIWCHEFEGGRSFYTEMGHTDESFSEPAYLGQLLGGIRWAMGQDD
ncbi:MAG: type 1 glutamine amidotransferase [Phycisphaerales bacterium]|jgi:type 1 glutamine amidotransferase